MKPFTILILSIFSLNAFAGQTITCAEYNKDGSISKRGASLKLELTFKGNSDELNSNKTKLTLDKVWKNDSDLGKEFEPISVNQSDADADVQYTHFFTWDAIGADIEYQLQFDQRILKKNFTKIPATLAFGYDCSCSENFPYNGIDLLCSSEGN